MYKNNPPCKDLKSPCHNFLFVIIFGLPCNLPIAISQVLPCKYQLSKSIHVVHEIIFGDVSDFIWDFGKVPFPTHLGKYFIKIGKIRAKIHEIGKIKAIFGLGMTPIYGLKNGQIKSLDVAVM